VSQLVTSLIKLRDLDGTLPDEIAVVVPVYMGKSCLRELCERLVASLSPITTRFSILLVDDRAPDNVWPLIGELGRDDFRIRGIQMSRNFGQHYAITAGLDHARARWYVVMDCDLQDAPEDIPRLYAKAQKGFDVVVGARAKEGHGYVKRHASKLFYAVFNRLAGFDLDWSVGNFRIFSDRVASGFRAMREQMRFFPASLSFMGFEVTAIDLPHHPSAAGKSSYTFGKLARLAGSAILAHSQTPLKIAAFLGLVMAALSLLAALWIIVLALGWGIPVTGWASLIVTVFVVGGVQIFVTGMVGIYVGKSFEEAKKRPLYFIRAYSNLTPARRGD
jgi:polyisoprenyl-phosphate glycosyltransferase